jgi:hypothetical protein
MNINALSEPFLVIAPDLSNNYPGENGSVLFICEGGMALCSSCFEKGEYKLSHKEIVSEADWHFCEVCNGIIL